MATMNISLTDPLKQFVDEEVREGGYSSTSDYVRDLIRQRQRQRSKAEELLKQLIAEGLASGPSAPLAPDHFDKLRERARNRK
ncbi:TPA: type II toxin-antitoxin system ParD family antitoxin [Stenotrophomonas maltophilia]|uniref:type II toxin-antitoxin system ParD family antitoxin n=1 Tax=Stenotrophomonas maltophilia TaxID=40324 RepID=UPI000C15BA80|nr:type II toxin-antitoxin system ParD family antitoxin [Stenotrophomonas maltophilia]